MKESRANQISECCVRFLNVRCLTFTPKGLKMDKLTKTYDDFFKQLIPESPLKEAFRKWNETTKQIEREKDEQ